MDNSFASTSYRIFWILLIIFFLVILGYLNKPQDDVDLTELSEPEESASQEDEKPPVWRRLYYTSVLQVPPVPPTQEPGPDERIWPLVTPPDLHVEEEPDPEYVAYVDESNDADIGSKDIVRPHDEPEQESVPPPQLPPPCEFECFP